MPVNSKHPEYLKNYEWWEKVEDCIDGQDEIKKHKQKYLPELGPKNPEIYRGYLMRAQYVNFSGRLLQAAIGQLFRKPPAISGVDDIIKENITLTGSNFISFSKECFKEAISYNRLGILVDYSEEQRRPYLSLFEAEEIINWKTKNVDGQEILSLIVIEGETENTSNTDQYKIESVKIWKEYYLDDNNVYNYREQHKVKDAYGRETFQVIPGTEKIPLMNNVPLNKLPIFIFPLNGEYDEIYKSQMLDIANLNLGHYKNSADYENMLHWTGAKTIITKNFPKEEIFPIGGRAEVGSDGDAFFLEASSSSGLLEEMRHKEEQMAMLGSQLLSGKGRYVASEKTSQTQAEGEYATLAEISYNMSYFMTNVCKLLIEWGGGDKSKTSIEYNTDFEMSSIPQGKLTEFMGARQSGAMSWKTFFYNLNGYELYPPGWSLEEEQKEISLDQKKDVAERQSILDSNIIASMAQNQQPINNQ